MVGRQVAPDLVRGQPAASKERRCGARRLVTYTFVVEARFDHWERLYIHNICDQISNGSFDREKSTSDFLEHGNQATEGYTLYFPMTGQLNFSLSSMQTCQDLDHEVQL